MMRTRLRTPRLVLDPDRLLPKPLQGRFGRPADPARSLGPSQGAEGRGRASADDDDVFDEALLARLRQLVLFSRRVVAQGITGEHRSIRRGASPEFADFKSYSQGDDFRRIDWNIYSRLDELFIRLSEVNTEMAVHLFIDSSRSMAWRGDPARPTKFTYARRLAGALAYVSLWHFDRVSITAFSQRPGLMFGPVQGRSQIQPALRHLSRLQADGATNLQRSVEEFTSARTRPGLMIIISDLLSEDGASLRAALRRLHGRGWQTMLCHVLDDLEIDPGDLEAAMDADDAPAIELVDLEQATRLRLTPSATVREQYRHAAESWLAEMAAICHQERCDYVLLQTSWPFETVVLRRLHEASMVA